MVGQIGLNKDMTNAAAAQTISTGQRVTLIAAPGYPTQSFGTVAEVVGRTLTVEWDTSCTESYTLRRNGKWALKGSGQWAMYLRAIAR